MTTYSEKLKDPRWQKKRLEILERDNWTCQMCQRTEITLVVHHKIYYPKLEPWECPNSSLITLCEECHIDESQIVNSYINQISQYFQVIFLSNSLAFINDGLGSFLPNPKDSTWLLARALNLIFSNERFRAFVVNHAYNVIHGDKTILRNKVKRIK